MSLKLGKLNIADRVLYAFFPKRCPKCGVLITPDEFTCDDCWIGISNIERPVCLRCGMSRGKCLCSDSKIRFSYIVAPFVYEGTVRRLLHRFKFDGETELNEFFATYMAQTAAREYFNVSFDYITNVPMTNEDLKKRGYNQGELLARRTGEFLNIEYCGNLILKTVQTDKQHDLSARERFVNLTEAFKGNREIAEGKTILLCDDIKTTGSTLYNCSAALKGAGAKEVYCLCAAVTDLFIR